MWYLEMGCVDGEVVVEQDVDVDDAVVIDAACRLLGAPHLAFDGRWGCQQFKGRESRLHTHGGIHKAVGRREAPRLGGIKRRLVHYMTDLHFYFLDGAAYVSAFVAKIGTETQINHDFFYE